MLICGFFQRTYMNERLGCGNKYTNVRFLEWAGFGYHNTVYKSARGFFCSRTGRIRVALVVLISNSE